MEPDDQRLVVDGRLSFADLTHMEDIQSENPEAVNSTQSADSPNIRQRLNELLHSQKAQYGIVALVVLDCIIVVVELLLDLKAIEVHHESQAPHVLHYISIAILSIFLIELILKIFAMGSSFLKHKMEVFDGFVVVVSFALDVAFSGDGQEGAIDGLGLLVILRLWRVTRIVNGIVLSVKMQAERKVAVLEKENSELKEELDRIKIKCTELEKELQTIKGSAGESSANISC